MIDINFHSHEIPTFEFDQFHDTKWLKIEIPDATIYIYIKLQDIDRMKAAMMEAIND